MKITDELMENVCILAKLELSKEEFKKAKEDMEQLVAFVDTLGEVDTEALKETGLEEVCVLREDEIINSDNRDELLANAPLVNKGMYIVPKTI